METVKLSSKGQVVIPKEIREANHWQPGATFNIAATAAGLMLMPVPLFTPTTNEQVAGCLHRSGRKKLTEHDMDAAVRSMAKERDEASKTGRNA
jgi:AbrB family looped-hinge helix DNA binding protein